MHKKFLNRHPDLNKYHDRLETVQVLGPTLGSLAFGAAGVAAFTEFIPEQPDRFLIASSLAAIAITGLAVATNASMKLPIIKSMMQADAQPETQSAPARQD